MDALERLVGRCFTGRVSYVNYEAKAKVLLVPSSGYLRHRDIFKTRMTGFAHVESIVSFDMPKNLLLMAAPLDNTSLLSALSLSPQAGWLVNKQSVIVGSPLIASDRTETVLVCLQDRPPVCKHASC